MYVTSLLLAIIMLSLFVTILELFTVEMCLTLTLSFRMGQGQMKICKVKAHVTSKLMAIVKLLLVLSYKKYQKELHIKHASTIYSRRALLSHTQARAHTHTHTATHKSDPALII